VHNIGEAEQVLNPQSLSALYGLPVRFAPQQQAAPILIADFGLQTIAR